jgi:hypothetical protein
MRLVGPSSKQGDSVAHPRLGSGPTREPAGTYPTRALRSEIDLVGHGRLQQVLWLTLLGVVAVALYSSGLRIPYYGDDWHHVYGSPPQDLLHYFLRDEPGGFFRPIEYGFLRVVQTHFGLRTFPIHITVILLHIILSWLVYVSMIELAFSRPQAFLGSLFMMVSQANVAAVLANDTFSQVGGALLGFVSVLFLYRHFLRQRADNGFKRHITDKNYWFSVIAFMFSLLFKETSTSFFLVVLIMVFLMNLRTKKQTSAVKRSVVQILPYVFVSVLYLLARDLANTMQPTAAPERYIFHLGAHVLKNFALLAFAVSIPMSSVTAFTLAKSGQIVSVSLIVASTLLVLAFMGYGLWRSSQRTTLLLLAGFAIVSFFPLVLSSHVGEHLSYNAMPFVSILVGVGLWKHIELSRNKLRRLIPVTLVLLALFASHAVAVRSKVSLMRQCGERAAMMVDRILAESAKVPRNGAILLADGAPTQIHYAGFLMGSFDVVAVPVWRTVRELSGREDIRIWWIEFQEIDQALSNCGPDCVVMLYNGKTLDLYKGQ